MVTMESQPLTARRLSWADQNAAPLASTIPQAPEPPPIGEEDDDDIDRPGVRTLEMGVLLQGYAYRSSVELPSNGQLVEVVGPLPEGVDILVKDEGSPEHPAALWIEAELKDLGVFYHGLLVRIAGGEFAEVVVNLKACVMGPREGRLSRIHHNVELIRALAPEDVHGSTEGSVFRKAAQLMEADDEDDG
ncbi:nipblb [Symbiodinium pilosum]|uniref:Nipblb protein n=1 Tax=Symbiodinium pilosum TaxID=2952 RepID=A0A812VGT1_SYMPI|nr:nipblb [Symbiodinium pilosum]